MYLLFKDDVTLDDMLYGIVQTYLIRSQLFIHQDDSKIINNSSYHHKHHHHQQKQQNQTILNQHHHHHHNDHADDDDHDMKFHYNLLHKCYTNNINKGISIDIINKIKNCPDWTLSESLVETNYNRIVMK